MVSHADQTQGIALEEYVRHSHCNVNTYGDSEESLPRGSAMNSSTLKGLSMDTADCILLIIISNAILSECCII